MAIALGCSSMMTSCTDYLTIYPTNEVIHENFWKTAEDVNAMLASCYSSMANNDIIQRMIVWGELRADNIMPRAGASNDLKYIVEANLLETNSYFKWEHFYKTINYCNLVLKYAPGVMNEDPDFTQGDLDVIKGEAYALRALCHFTLVRAFRDIPISLSALDADDQDMTYPQYSPYVALDYIKADLDSAAKYCMNTGGWSASEKNVSRITKNAVYAMRADVNLWRAAFAQYSIVSGDPVKYYSNDSTVLYKENGYTPEDVNNFYTQVIEDCDSVIAITKRAIIKEYDDQNKTMIGLDTLNNPYFLCVNNPAIRDYPTIYDEIFCGVQQYGREGYITPEEVIFKLDFNSSNSNGAVNGFYGYDKSSGSLIVPSKAPIALVGELYKKSDSRYYSFTSIPRGGISSDNKESYTITKYTIKSANRVEGIQWYGNGKNYLDWIFYRKTDVLLMKAVALAYRYKEANGADIPGSDHNEAFRIVQTINKRNISVMSDSLKPKDFKSKENLQQLVYDERLRELTYEGKRWFDLVQKALYEGTTKNILDLVTKKLDSNEGAVKTKMSTIHTLFSPIYESELILNPLLKQNPAFVRSTSTEKN